jgi:predicted dehydrogenase
MRFALLGDHPDGLDMARALVESGRHELAVYCGVSAGAEVLARWGLKCKTIGDVEEVLANPAVEAVIVAARPASRPDLLRRSLQAERHVLCVQPVDTTPDTAYEAALIQGDTRQVLLPLFPEAGHPGLQRLAERMRASLERGELRLVEMERWSTERVLVEAGGKKQRISLPGWDVLRALGGEVAELFAFASHEEVEADEPLLLMGRFERGGLFQASFLSRQSESRWRVGIVTRHGREELIFPESWPGPARLTWQDETGASRVEEYPTWNPWPALVDLFDEAVAAAANPGNRKQTGMHPVGEVVVEKTSVPEGLEVGMPPPRPQPTLALTWQDAVRQLELDDAARRSVAKRRASTLEYQEATEEAGFKGLMTLFGCALLWASIILLILSRWVPWAGWLIAPLFGIFLIMQLLRWGVPKADEKGSSG